MSILLYISRLSAILNSGTGGYACEMSLACRAADTYWLLSLINVTATPSARCLCYPLTLLPLTLLLPAAATRCPYPTPRSTINYTSSLYNICNSTTENRSVGPGRQKCRQSPFVGWASGRPYSIDMSRIFIPSNSALMMLCRSQRLNPDQL